MKRFGNEIRQRTVQPPYIPVNDDIGDPHLEAFSCLRDDFSPIGKLPREILFVGASEVAVNTGVLVDRPLKVQMFDDCSRTKVE